MCDMNLSALGGRVIKINILDDLHKSYCKHLPDIANVYATTKQNWSFRAILIRIQNCLPGGVGGLKSLFKLEFQPEFSIQLNSLIGIPILMGIIM